LGFNSTPGLVLFSFPPSRAQYRFSLFPVFLVSDRFPPLFFFFDALIFRSRSSCCGGPRERTCFYCVFLFWDEPLLLPLFFCCVYFFFFLCGVHFGFFPPPGFVTCDRQHFTSWRFLSSVFFFGFEYSVYVSSGRSPNALILQNPQLCVLDPMTHGLSLSLAYPAFFHSRDIHTSVWAWCPFRREHRGGATLFFQSLSDGRAYPKSGRRTAFCGRTP